MSSIHHARVVSIHHPSQYSTAFVSFSHRYHKPLDDILHNSRKNPQLSSLFKEFPYAVTTSDHFAPQQHQQWHKHRQEGLTILNMSRGKDDRKGGNDEEDISSIVIDNIYNLISAPTPGLENLALGFPLLLASAFIFLPGVQSLALIVFFASFSYLGRVIMVVDDDDENDDGDDYDEFVSSTHDREEDSKIIFGTDTVSLLAAVASTALLIPSFSSTEFFVLDWSRGVSLSVLFLASFLVSRGSRGLRKDDSYENKQPPERTLFDIWDDQLEDLATKKGKKK